MQLDDATLAAAFRDLHGSRLHGFATLVTLGDEPLAERVAGFALAAGARQAAALRHPERAAAWLRARTLRSLRERRPRRSTPLAERLAALAALGADETVRHGLAALNIDARAALVASDVERFDPIDVETILNASPAAARHAVSEARHRYLRAIAPPAEGDDDARWHEGPPNGELAGRVEAVATRAFSTGEPRR